MSAVESACVFDVQRFSVHDGPGIRTVVFLKGCNLRCAWCHNPEAMRAAPELAYWPERCVVGCRQCLDACELGALRESTRGRVDWARCDHCGQCAETCPSEALVAVGRRMSVHELLEEVLRDRAFYESSGGGVTLSGGEPVLHSTFLARFLPWARTEGLHLAMETAGSAPWSLFEPLVEHLDLVLFDLKLMDAEDHRRWTGRDNHDVHEVLRRLLVCSAERNAAACGSPASRRRLDVVVRMPVIPGVNTGDDNVEATAAFLAGLGVRSLELLPYNQLWEAKLDALAAERAPLGLRPCAAGYYEELVRRFADAGLQATGAHQP
jgi:pyruvate formate lyase activating enzyme